MYKRQVQDRVTGWLDPFSDPDGQYFQIVQGLYGLAFGGMVGTGLGQGDPTQTPFSYSDFIVTSLGEELGLAGLMAIIGLLLRISHVTRRPTPSVAPLRSDDATQVVKLR